MKKKIGMITIILSLLCLVWEIYESRLPIVVERNGYGEGGKTEIYELEVPDQKVETSMEVEVGEREYTKEEVQDVFTEVSNLLEQLILKDNESMNHVETDLNLVTEVEGYPVSIRWESSSYRIIGQDGTIGTDEIDEKGELVELRAVMNCQEEESIYVCTVCVYPVNRTGVDKLLYEIEQAVLNAEKETREEAEFVLPDQVDGISLIWKRNLAHRWAYILLIGGVVCILLWYREREEKKAELTKRKEQFIREYPGMVSKTVMLLGTGLTVRQVFEKMTQNYDRYKDKTGVVEVYEEMKRTLREMQGGISEREAYERFGKRCGESRYVKFGVMLSQNLRKGSQGMCELLNGEAVQAFEERKARAKKLGEEASTKLLVPMLLMLLVVLLVIMVPALFGMQL